MAGETRGEMAEAIAKVALNLAVERQSKGYKVFWEEPPDNSVIKPDLTVGLNKNTPANLILVNASDTVSNSHMKYWRNICEVFDSKARLANTPLILNLVFKSEIKSELIRLIAALCDSTHHVDLDHNHGRTISMWLEKNHASAPSNKTQKEALVISAIQRGTSHYNESFSVAVRHLGETLALKLKEQRKELIPLWDLLKRDFETRRTGSFRKARVTVLRRGLARWLVFDPEVREAVFKAQFLRKPLPKEQTPPYALLLGMLAVHINGSYIPSDNPQTNDMVSTTASDLRHSVEFYNQAAGNDFDAAFSAFNSSLVDAPAEMLRAAALLREMPARVSTWHEYVKSNWRDLTSPAGCYQALMNCRSDPTMRGAVGQQDESRVWLYDHLIAILRAYAGRNNDFGYGALTSYFKSRRNDAELSRLFAEVLSDLDSVETRKSRAWINNTLPRAAEPGRRGFQDWLAGTKNITPAVIAAFAFSLSRLLSEVEGIGKMSLHKLVSAHAYGLWNKLLTHQDFEPLASLILVACENRVRRTSAPTIMADLAERAVQNAGFVTVFAFDGGMIYWKSVTDAGKDHKRKELCARARALRFQKMSKGFMERPEAKRLFLVVDGTFNDTDIRVLCESGWDGIFYPDEMEKLVNTIESSN